MRRAASSCYLLVSFALTACASPVSPVVEAPPPGSRDPLYGLERVRPGRLEYAPDRTTFAPVLTERFAYPTQAQANRAYRRLMAGQPADRPAPVSVWLFGCKPGALDQQTARVARYRAPVVHCATDFLDANGRRVRRETANFDHDRAVWNMKPVDPPRTLVPWRDRERSPKDAWWWLPGRARYE